MSCLNSIEYKYLIIDESSQVDIIKSAVCFSRCRNVVVVGDSMQLTHIVDKQSQEAAEQFQKEYHISPAVVMTRGNNHPFRIIETSISGGRNYHNQRQIDETNFYIRENYASDYTKVGVIAPYRNHANMLQQRPLR